ncbi:uncharacterized protein LOC118440073, partial [Vespa mandarinia]|uniref:uncharacterized protein LOC118440073 n=1 Tax=Vespa mandarinia TaxID=7446 RepID=UPI00161D3357
MTPVVFYLTYAHQMIALTLGAVIHIALDTLISDLLLNICCQIRILENRLTNITNERKVILKLCIRHHECIYGFAADVNRTFKFAIFVQFLASTFIICFTLFQITKISVNSMEFLKMTLFMFGMLIQVYLYCWYGHLVTVKSKEIIYQMFDTDLMELNNDIKKSLLIMMHRTTRPIVIIVMNLFPCTLCCQLSQKILSLIRKMMILASSFTILSICGCWRPPSWSLSFYKRFAYNLYTIFIAFVVSTVSLSQAIGIVLNEGDSSDSSDDIYIFFAILISCFKMLSLIINRNKIVNFVSTLRQKPYKPSDGVETRIQIKFDNWSRLNTHCYVFLLFLSTVSFISLSVTTNLSEEIATIIFDIDWITLSDDIRKNLLFMMKRTMKPIVFVVIRILPVNFDSFVKVLKTSYSAYNILQQ